MTEPREGTSCDYPSGDPTSLGRWLLLVAALSPVLWATLTPAGEGSVLKEFLACLICGEFGTANLIRNVILFIPLGAALALVLGSGKLALLTVLGITASIEVLQLYLPGRNPMVVDIGANWVGGTLGIALVRWSCWWLTPTRHVGAILSCVAAAVAAVVMLLSASMLAVELPSSDYWGQWTPHQGHLVPYEGRVLSAFVDDLATPSRRLDAPGAVRESILGGAPVRLEVELGPAPPSLAPIFSIYDGQRREILLIGAQEDHLVGRVRLRAHRFRLDRPDVRIQDVLAGWHPGDTVALTYRAAAAAVCLSMDEREECGLGPGVERGWALLRFLQGSSERLRRVMDFGWMMGLLLPFGYFARLHLMSLAGLGALAAVLLSLSLGPSPVSFSLFGLAGMVVGVVVGVILSFAVRSFLSAGVGDRHRVRESG